MIITEIKFGGVKYPCRMVKDNQGELLTIGSTALLDALQPAVLRTTTRALPARKHRTSTMRFSISPTNIPLPCPTKNW